MPDNVHGPSSCPVLEKHTEASFAAEKNHQCSNIASDTHGSHVGQDTQYSVYGYGYGAPFTVSGWMYVNEQGQMCGPYIQGQLYEGLSTGFLPPDIPVYPVVNGTLLNSVPLKYFKQFPDHVSTGFAYLNPAIYNLVGHGHVVSNGSDSAAIPTVCTANSSAPEALQPSSCLKSQLPDQPFPNHEVRGDSSSLLLVPFCHRFVFINSEVEVLSSVLFAFPSQVKNYAGSFQMIWGGIMGRTPLCS